MGDAGDASDGQAAAAAAAGEPQIEFEERGHVTVMRLNRPEKLNAWTAEMGHLATDFFETLNRGEYGTRCVVVTGAGRAFCAGGDVSRFPAAQASAPPVFRVHGRTTRKTVRAMRDCATPFIAAVNGYALGLGFALALSTDIRIASEDAQFGVAQTKRGIMPDFSLGHLLKQAVGSQRAFELIFSGRTFGAEEALELGLVLEVVPAERLMDRALELAEMVAEGPPLAHSASKRLMYMDELAAQEQRDAYTDVVIPQLLLTDDGLEGTRSFLERRDAEFTGR